MIACQEDYVDTVERLVHHGCDVSSEDHDVAFGLSFLTSTQGRTGFFLACQNGRINTLRYLIGCERYKEAVNPADTSVCDF